MHDSLIFGQLAAGLYIHFSVCTKLFYNLLQCVTSSSMFERATVLSHCYCTDYVSIILIMLNKFLLYPIQKINSI